MNRIPFKPEHLFTLNSVEAELRLTLRAKMESLGMDGPSTTIVDGEEIVACGGIRTLWPRSGEAWGSLSSKRKGPELFRLFRSIIDEWSFDYDRIQAMTITGWKQGERSLEFLGFKFETVLRKFGPNGIDQSLYSRIR